MQATAFLLFFAVFSVAGISAQDEGRRALFGKEAWLPDYFDKVHLRQTKDAESILALTSKERPLSPSVDLLLHFNAARPQDETGRYQIMQQPVYSDSNALFGRAAGFFQGQGGLVLRPSFDTFLGYGSDRDFRIRFWFYPFLVEDGEVLFEWEGQRTLNGTPIPQRISAVFQTNRVVWQFRNVFLAPGQARSLYEVRSEVYIPESWYHQQLIYDGNTAMLELFNDKSSVATAYTTTDGSARGARTTLMLSNPHLTDFSIGPRFFGLIDEWEISRRSERIRLAPTLFYYPSGMAYSKIIDMGDYGAQVYRIKVHSWEPENSKLLLYYVANNDRNTFADPASLPWQRIKGSKGLFDNLENLRGRFIQFKIELLSDLRAQASPSVQGLEVFYSRQRLPAPPSNILVNDEQRGGVHVQWQPSVNNQVLGYRIFLGEYSSQYLQPGYPVDVGDDTSFLFSDLEPKKQYFFVIASYDKYDRVGPFSEEYSIRYIAN